MSEDSVNVYVRNSQKVGRIIKISAGITAEALYQTAAESHSLAPENIHLYLQGKLIENDQTPCELKEKAIIHLVNNQDLDRETIEIKVKDLNGSQTTSFEVDSSTNIKEFIDSKLPENFGANTEELVLVYIGRQLKSDKSFKEEKVQNGSQIFCVNIQQAKAKYKAKQAQIERNINHKIESPSNKEKSQNPFKLESHEEVNAKSDIDLVYNPSQHKASMRHDYSIPAEEVIPETEVEKNAEDYRQEHFKLDPHKEVNAVDKVDLVYNASVHKTSSLHDYNLPPDEVIPESNNANIEEEQEKEPEEESKEPQEPIVSQENNPVEADGQSGQVGQTEPIISEDKKENNQEEEQQLV